MLSLELIYIGGLTLFSIGLIYHYEKRVKYLEHHLKQMTKRFHIARNSHIDMDILDEENTVLKAQLKALKAEIAENDGPYWAKMYHELLTKSAGTQYESSTYKSSTWESSAFLVQEDIDFDQ